MAIDPEGPIFTIDPERHQSARYFRALDDAKTLARNLSHIAAPLDAPETHQAYWNVCIRQNIEEAKRIVEELDAGQRFNDYLARKNKGLPVAPHEALDISKEEYSK